MYIASIHLSNFKSFRTSSISLSEGINIFVSKNNSGKSSVIRSVYLLKNDRSISPDDIRKGHNKCQIITAIQDISEKDL